MLLLTCLYMSQTASQSRRIFALYVCISHAVCTRQYNVDMLSNYLLNENEVWMKHMINLDQQ